MNKETAKQIFNNADLYWKIIFCVCLVISLLLIIGSFFMPPMGVVDGSILAATGELFAWPTLFAVYNIITSGRAVTFKKGDMEVSTELNKM